jgi:hypothetical protein
LHRYIAHFTTQAGVTQGVTNFCLVYYGFELFGTQHWHGSDCNRSDLHDGKPAGHHHRVIRPMQQNPVPGDDAHGMNEYVGDAIGFVKKIGIRPTDLGRTNTQAVALPKMDTAIQ